MYILLGAGGYLGHLLATHLSSNRISFLTVSRSFQWNQVDNEYRFVTDVSNTSLYASRIPDNSILIYGWIYKSSIGGAAAQQISRFIRSKWKWVSALKNKNISFKKAFFSTRQVQYMAMLMVVCRAKVIH